MCLVYLVRNPMMVVLAVEERPANTRRGNAIPNPKKANVNTLMIKSVTSNVLVKSAAINKGLHGTTIAPKKNPKRNALRYGFFASGG